MSADPEPTVTMPLRRHVALMAELEDVRDRLSIYERAGDTVSLADLPAELDRLQTMSADLSETMRSTLRDVIGAGITLDRLAAAVGVAPATDEEIDAVLAAEPETLQPCPPGRGAISGANDGHQPEVRT